MARPKSSPAKRRPAARETLEFRVSTATRARIEARARRDGRSISALVAYAIGLAICDPRPLPYPGGGAAVVRYRLTAAVAKALRRRAQLDEVPISAAAIGAVLRHLGTS